MGSILERVFPKFYQHIHEKGIFAASVFVLKPDLFVHLPLSLPAYLANLKIQLCKCDFKKAELEAEVESASQEFIQKFILLSRIGVI